MAIMAQTRQTTRKGKKTKHAHKNMKINGNTTNKQTQIRNCIVQLHATKATKAAKQIPSGIKSEISYRLEDGHVGRDM
jgi:hypothetical protein